MIKEYTILVKGLVQGVGFRPFVYHLATSMHLNGSVENRNNGVSITLQATQSEKDLFIARLNGEKPSIARIVSVEVKENSLRQIRNGFVIEQSRSIDCDITGISPDIAVCSQCLEDIKRQPHRINYPLANCTNCGPRFSIIEALPYDRKATTMAEFEMCPTCREEYNNVADRRFHAQPTACNNCGQHFYINNDSNIISIINKTYTSIDNGLIVAIKGVGGYAIICDATNREAVSRLREIKHREQKPFAVMFASLETLKEYCFCNEAEQGEITSWRRPIVLLREKKEINPLINQGLGTIGALLPYFPIHYMLFEKLKTQCIVFTSGNLAGEPIAIDEAESETKFADKADLIVHHNRKISNRIDDSVIQVVDNKPSIIRRARGYVPESIEAPRNVDGIIGLGAELSSTFALGKDNLIINSQYIGDLKNIATYNFFEESLAKQMRLFRIQPRLIVCDKHPDYLSTQKAKALADMLSTPCLQVQHHHAHAVSVMVEHKIESDVLAITLDGIGYGDDGNLWGGEIMQCNTKGYKRLDHLDYIAMPGGDAASKEPWRMAVAYVHHYLRDEPKYMNFLRQHYANRNVETIIKMIDNSINTPLTSSCGRLFDAVSSLLGICDISTFQAEAPIRLESIASDNEKSTYSFKRGNISLNTVIKYIIDDIIANKPIPEISAKFHNTLCSMFAESAIMHSRKTGITTVVLSGGTFQNRRMLSGLTHILEQSGLRVLTPSKIPMNDGGIAQGQIGVAMNYLPIGEKEKVVTNNENFFAETQKAKKSALTILRNTL